MSRQVSRREFIQVVAAGAGALQFLSQVADAEETQGTIQGFEQAPRSRDSSKGWTPFSDRKLRVGLDGYGVCEFVAAFGFQGHPNA